MARIKIDLRVLGDPTTLHLKDKMVIEVPENPTTGFRWQTSAGSQLQSTADRFIAGARGAMGSGGVRS